MMGSMPLREEQEAALGRLVAGGELSVEQADAVRREFSAVPERRGWLAEVGGYVGGGFMIVGGGLFLGSQWDRFGRGFQVLILAGLAVVFVLGAVLAAGDAGFRRAAGARGRAAGGLLALAAVPVALAAGTAAGSNEGAWAFGVGLLAGVGGLIVRSNVLGIVITGVMTAGAVLMVTDEVLDTSWLVSGLALLVAGIVWGAAALTSWVRPAQLAFTVAGALAIVGAQAPIDSDSTKVWAYVLTLAVATACFLLYRWKRMLVMLVGGVAGVTIAVPEIVYDVAGGGLNPALILLVAGVVLVASSALAMQLRRE
jgi:hypothetical protein